MEEPEEKLTLTAEQLAEFFAAAAGNRFDAFFVVGTFTAARPQEILGVKWPDLVLPDDPEAFGLVRLRRRVSMASGRLEINDGLKSGRRKKPKKGRDIDLFPEVVAALKAHRARYLEERVRSAARWEATWRENPKARDLVFPSRTGGPMDRDNLLSRYFKPVARAAGLPSGATFYTLRHTFSTLWLESGENPRVLQEILGHSRIDLTLNTYTHVLPHVRSGSMERFRGRFYPPTEGPSRDV
jgi:integrase